MKAFPASPPGSDDLPPSRRHLNTLAVILLLLALLVLSVSLERRFSHDEFEHIHATWYIGEGHIPYSDFYENHHPLFWCALLPFLIAFGETTTTPVVLRVLMFSMTLGIAFASYRISRRVTHSTEAALYSALLLLSVVLFVRKSIEIRPDVPQTLFGLVSIYYFVRHLETRDDKHMLASGLAASISFLFLQKAAFLMMVYSLLFSYKLLRRDLAIRSIVSFSVAFIVPLLPFVAFLIASESLSDYLLTAWKVNLTYARLSPPSNYLSRTVWHNLPFWTFALIGVAYTLRNERARPGLRATALIGLGLLLSVFLVKHPYRQYFMFGISVLSVVSGYGMKRCTDLLALREIHRVLVLLLILIVPAVLLVQLSSRTNHHQLERMDFVLRNSDRSDLVYDGGSKFNLYRKDLHYFWYSVGKASGRGAYEKLTDGHYGDYDVCALIKTKKPKFITDHALDLRECGLTRLYEETRYDGVYVRRETEHGEGSPRARPDTG